MADQTWPSTLPQRPRPDGYKENLGTADIRSSVEVGPAKVRKRYTKRIPIYEWSFDMSLTQVAALEAFYDLIGLRGTFDFTGGDPRTGSAYTYRFLEGPNITHEGGENWSVHCKVEKLP